MSSSPPRLGDCSVPVCARSPSIHNGEFADIAITDQIPWNLGIHLRPHSLQKTVIFPRSGKDDYPEPWNGAGARTKAGGIDTGPPARCKDHRRRINAQTSATEYRRSLVDPPFYLPPYRRRFRG